MAIAKAGWAQFDSTPPLGLPMGGRGPRFTLGTVVLDPLLVQAVVIEDGKGYRTLWISMDMIGMSWQMTSRFRYELASLTGIPFEAIVINFSHTHSGPMSGFEGYATIEEKPTALEAYEMGLLPRTVAIVREAINTLQPVTVRVCRGASEIGINRRRLNADGSMGMGPNLDGYMNRDLWVLDLCADKGRCVVFNYGCHPVMVYGFAWDGISADFPGVCRNRLAEVLGPNTHAQFIQGLAGNVRPRRLADLDTGTFRKSTPEDVVATGDQLADDVLAAIDRGGESIDLDLSCVSEFVMAPRDQDAILPLSHWEALANGEDELERNLGSYWVARFHSGVPPVRFLPWDVGLIRLAKGHTIAWLANEVFAEWLLHLRTWLNEPNLIAWGYCQDGRNYMPTDEVLPQGGYEIDRANAYTKTGPGPFKVGMNDAAKKTFRVLSNRI
ncbi:MAG: neutral ceramidase [Candidatus Latescibacterota bacterium]|jgi:neutral ceramidase